MKSIPLALVFFVLFTGMCRAHNVNVFAFVDGGEIQVECSFSKSQKVKNGRLVITDLENGDIVLEGVADERGIFRFRPSDEFLATGHGLNIRLFAGEGHRDDWKITPGELGALSRGERAGTAPRTGSGDGMTTARQPQTKLPAANAAEFEAIVEKALDARLSPINQALAELREEGPGLRDIVGGVGWILGLLGLAVYMKHRR